MEFPFNSSHYLLRMNRSNASHYHSLQTRFIEHHVEVTLNLYVFQILPGPFAFLCIWCTCCNYLCAWGEIVEVEGVSLACFVLC